MIEWYYTYYDVKEIQPRLIKALQVLICYFTCRFFNSGFRGMSNVGHLERLRSDRRLVIFPDEIEGKYKLPFHRICVHV
jgi:CRISPR/Cas system-associated endoribonuclease Cas2